MKKNFLNSFLPIFISVVFVLSFSLSVNALFGNAKSEEYFVTASFSKNGECGQVITFDKSDFTDKSSSGAELDGIVIASLPDESEGILLLGSKEILKFEGIAIEQIDDLRFIPTSGEETVGKISFVPVFNGISSNFEPSVITVNLSNSENHIPIAEDLTFETYKNMSICGKFRATDSDGKKLTYKIIDNPKYADIEIEDDGFRYTPHKDKCGKDTFKYVATDEKGNTSDVATVTIIINRRSEKGAISYADMDSSTAHFAAVRLAELGIMTGEKIGASYFFNPQKTVSRGEFIAMTVLAANIATPTISINTGLYDDGEIPKWAKPYVSAGLNAGIINGIRTADGNYVFNAGREITSLEAAVILNNLISTNSEVAVGNSSEDIPIWAADAVASLKSANVISSDVLPSAVTREDAAQMIYNIIKFIEEY